MNLSLMRFAIGVALAMGAVTGFGGTIRPTNTKEPLVNPGMGWVYYHYDNSNWNYGAITKPGDTLDWFPGVSTIYFRLPWSDLEPEEGKFRWDVIDTYAQSWLKAGKQLAFRLTCSESGYTFATPEWVLKAGANGKFYTFGNKPDGKKLWEPDFLDPIFLAKLDNFLKAAAAHYDRDTTAFVDVGSFGMWGEGHTGYTSKLSAEKQAEIAIVHSQLHKKHFHIAPVVISDDVAREWGKVTEDHPLMAKLRAMGVGFRDDSIMVDKKPTHWFHQKWARKFAEAGLPVVVESGHYFTNERTKKTWFDTGFIDSTVEYRAHFQGIHWWPREFLECNRADIDRTNLRLGYRFELRQASWLDAVENGEENTVNAEWVNVGVAAPIEPTFACWSLLDDQGVVRWAFVDESRDFRSLPPCLEDGEKAVKIASSVRFGWNKRSVRGSINSITAKLHSGKLVDFGLDVPTIAPGTYTLAVSLGRADGTPRIALPLTSQVGNTRRYALGKMAIAPSNRSARLDRWEFSKDGIKWQNVRVPHDWAIDGDFDKTIDMQTVAIVQNGEKKATEKTGRTGSLPWIGKGQYRCRIHIPEGTDYAALLFDGAMSEPEVFCDGNKVGEWKNGYNAFKVELPAVKGDHDILVKLNNREKSSRWYPGAGLIRPVELVLGKKAGVEIWGNAIWTPDLKTVKVRTELRHPELIGKVTYRIPEFNLTCDSKPQSSTATFNLQSVANVSLWTPETPTLYTMITEVYDKDGALIDRVKNRFGVRTVEYGKGYFALNGKKRKFQGVCLHHDLGPLGAAFNGDAFRRQVALLKEMGCDSIRTSHNMPGDEQLEICDEMGMMVMAESFDAWEVPKVANGYNLFFKDWWKRDIENLVKKCRNHPSVVMWSIGNEVPDQVRESGRELTIAMQNEVHRFDPDPARKITQGASDMPGAIKSGVTSAMEIPAVTYRLKFYEDIWKSSDTGLMLGAETASTISSRGEYFFDGTNGVVANTGSGNPQHRNLQCNGYDLEFCPWSNLPDDDWAMQEDHSWTIGEFVWTGFDYLGEPTPYDNFWPSRSSYFGIFDLAGIPKDRYWLYRSHWNHKEHTCHLLPHWTWSGREGKVVPVYCYTDCDKAELFVNGKSQGIRIKDKNSRLDRFRLRWNNVVYEPGEISVVAYAKSKGKDGQEEVVARDSVKTALKAVQIRTECRRFGKLVFATATLLDANSTPVPNDDQTLKVSCSGNLKFRGICNGDATSVEKFTQPTMRTFHGQLVAIAEGEFGEVSFEFANATHSQMLHRKILSNDRDYVFVACHQGDHRFAPGNTTAAIEGAIKLGADIIELDVLITKDNKFLLQHDRMLKQGTNSWKVSEMTLDEFKRRVKYIGGYRAKFDVITLEDALRITKGKALINVDGFTDNPKQILDELNRLNCLSEVLLKSDLPPDKAKQLFGEYWGRVESGEILYMPVIQFCWGRNKYAAGLLPKWLAQEPRIGSMYEVCFTTDDDFKRLDPIRQANSRIWVNTMWDNLWPNRGEQGHGKIDPDFVWAKALSLGATMIQVDNAHILIPYLKSKNRR